MSVPTLSQSLAHSNAAPTLQGLTVLVIEDEPMTQELLEEALQFAGAHVILSTTCQAALALLQQRHFDVILSNIVLPDGSGYTLLQQWRLWEQAHDLVCTPAVAVTAAVTTVSRTKAKATGFQAFVAKPYDFEQLFRAITTVMGNRPPVPLTDHGATATGTAPDTAVRERVSADTPRKQPARLHSGRRAGCSGHLKGLSYYSGVGGTLLRSA